MPVNEEVKKIIEDVKHSRGIRQSDVAMDLGIKSTYLSDVINGRVPFSEKLRDKISEVYSDVFNDDLEKLRGADSYYFNVLKKLIDNGTFTPVHDVEKKDEEIKRLEEEIKRLEEERIKLYKEIGRLEERLEQSKKTGAQEDENVICAAVV